MRQLNSLWVSRNAIAFVAWSTGMIFLLLMPMSDYTENLSNKLPIADKLVHLILFAVQAFLLAKALMDFDIKATSGYILLFGLSFAFLTEYFQRWTSYRRFDWNDIIFDLIGVISFLILRKFLDAGKHAK